MLNVNIARYNELQLKVEEMKTEMEKLKLSIVEDMDNLGIDTQITPEGISAKVGTRENYKYNDEERIIEYLKENGLAKFIVEKVNTTPMNTELKKGLKLTEDLKPLYTKTIVRTLSVKEAN